MSWQELQLRDVAFLNYGKSLPERDRALGEVPVYGSGGVTGSHNESMVSGPGIIVGRKGTVGAVYWETRDFFPIDTVYYAEPARKDVDKRFLYYILKSLPLASMNQDAAVPGLNRETAYAVRVRLPDVETQKRTAAKLQVIDDLIENNRRRIKLLEDAARLLYREWFVHLRFPGHEHVKVVDGVPEGWERKVVPDLIAINPTERIERGREAWYVPMASLSETGMTVDRGDFERRTVHTVVKFRANDVLLARITPCLENGKTGFVYFLDEGDVACGSTEFIVLRGTSVSPYFVYCLARTYDFREHAIKSMIGSSGRQRVQAGCFDEYVVTLPPSSVLREFDDSVAPMFKQIAVLDQQTEKLRQARDLLLPRLMSGELSV